MSTMESLQARIKTPVRAAYRVLRHPHHARLHHFALNAEELRAFFSATQSIRLQELEYVPYVRYVVASALAERMGERFPETLRGILHDRSSGGFTLGAQGVTSRLDDFVKLGTAIGHLIGPANFDSMSGTYYARFVVKDADQGDSYLKTPYRALTLHTDGTFVDETTDWLLMMKFEERNAIGGESRLIHLDDWEDLEIYRRHPLASHPFTFKAPKSKNAIDSVRHPIFFDADGRPCISVIDQFVYPETIAQAAYLSAMFASLERSPGTATIPLPVGDLIVLNNRFWMHGRAPFQAHAGLHRELMRQRGVFAKE
jgi:glutarate dioxygenase